MSSPSSRSRVGPILAIVVVLVLLVAGGLYVQRISGKDRVAFVGDSITVLTEPDYRDRLGGDHHVEVRAIGAKEVAEMMPSAGELAATNPDQVVINLGTNDVIHGKDPAAAAKAIEDMAATFPSQRCIHLITVNEGMFSTEGKDLTTPARQLNQAIKQLAQTKGYRVIDWAEKAATYAKAGEPSGPLTSDTIHPEAAGKKILTDAVKESVDACKLAPI